MNPELPPLELKEQNKPKGRLRQFVLVMLMGAFGAVLGSIFSLAVIDLSGPSSLDGQTLLILLSLIPAFFIAIGLHELGHLIAAALAGFKFYSVQVGPLRLTQTPQGLRFGMQWSLALAGGMAVAYPTHTEALKGRALLYYAGGPLFSLATGLSAFFYMWNGVLLPQGPIDITLAEVPLVFFALISLIIAIGTMIPSRMMGMASDGARIFSILFNLPIAKRDLALFALFGLSHSGIRPRDWDRRWIEDVDSVHKRDFMSAVANAILYIRALDLQNLAEAGQRLQYALDIVEADKLNYRPNLILEAVYFEAAIRGDLERASLWREQLPKAKKGMASLDPIKAHRAEAAFFLLRGDRLRIQKHIEDARKALAQSLDLGANQVEYALLDALEARIPEPHRL